MTASQIVWIKAKPGRIVWTVSELGEAIRVPNWYYIPVKRTRWIDRLIAVHEDVYGSLTDLGADPGGPSSTTPVVPSSSDLMFYTKSEIDDLLNDITATIGSSAPMTGATSGSAGTGGTVPAPSAGAQGYFLRGDGTWSDATGGASAALPLDGSFAMTGALDMGAHKVTKLAKGTAADDAVRVDQLPAAMGSSGASHAAGLVPDPGPTAGTTRFLREDGGWVDPTPAAMTGANGTTAGAAGLVPAPAATDNTKFLRGDGTYADPAPATNAITNAKLAKMPAHTFKGNNTAASADPLDLSITQTQTELATGFVAQATEPATKWAGLRWQNTSAAAISGIPAGATGEWGGSAWAIVSSLWTDSGTTITQSKTVEFAKTASNLGLLEKVTSTGGADASTPAFYRAYNPIDWTNGPGGSVNYRDHIFHQGWNFNGSQVDTALPALGDSWESKFYQNGKFAFERHIQGVHSDGTAFRTFGLFIPQAASGGSIATFNTDFFNISTDSGAARVAFDLAAPAPVANFANGTSILFSVNNTSAIRQYDSSNNSRDLLFIDSRDRAVTNAGKGFLVSATGADTEYGAVAIFDVTGLANNKTVLYGQSNAVTGSTYAFHFGNMLATGAVRGIVGNQTAGGNAYLESQSASGDAFSSYVTNAEGNIWNVGVDQSAAATFKISYSAGARRLGGSSGAEDKFAIDTNGNIVLGKLTALATSATDGFPYAPTCAGTPTGAPTSFTGHAPFVVDTTGSKIWVYVAGTWKSAALT